MYFVGKKGGVVKKRYAGICRNKEWEDCEKIIMKGVERTDQAPITLYALRKFVEMVLKEGKSIEEFVDWLNKLKKDISNGKVPISELVFRVAIRPDKEYKVKTHFLRGLEFAQKLGYVDAIVPAKYCYIYIKDPRSDIITVPDEKVELLRNFKIDYDRCSEYWFDFLDRNLISINKEVSKKIEKVCDKKVRTLFEFFSKK
jgi:DNA polymerase elongation subunit (family B)